MIVRPSGAVRTETVCRLIVGAHTVWASLPEKRDDFREVVRAFGCRWDGSRWRREIKPLAGDPVHRAAELGHSLLGAGFIVEFANDLAQQLAVSGEYEPECKRWILAGTGEYDGWFAVRWFWPEDDWRRANLLSGCRYDPVTKAVVVPTEHFAEVEDYAEMHGYCWTPEARGLLAHARQRRDDMLVVEIAPAPKPAVRRQAHTGADPAVFADYPDRDFGLLTTLMPHQVPAVDKLLPLRIGALFMDQGLGKTRCTIELAHRRRGRISNVVWFCPVNLRDTIAAEIAKHTGCAAHVFDDDTACGNIPDALWHVVGIESMSASARVVLAANAIIDAHSFVIVDESSYIKGHAAKRTRRITALAERAQYRLVLTGTPLSQGVVDLYSQMRFLSPDILGYRSFYSFAAGHLEYHPDYPGMIVSSHGADLLASKIAPFVYQVSKADAGLNLPDKLYDVRYYGLTRQQKELYDRAKNEILMSAPDAEIDSYIIFRLFTALQQVASGFWHRAEQDELIETPHLRVDMLLDTIRAIPTDAKVIVWCKFLYSVDAVTDALAAEYGPRAVARHDGRVRDRAGGIARFRGPARFLVATQSTGGHGLTLNEAHHVIFYENGFKYSERIQAEDRCHRIGQEHPVTYVDLVCNCGIDDRIQKALERKQNVVESFRREVGRVKLRDLRISYEHAL